MKNNILFCAIALLLVLPGLASAGGYRCEKVGEGSVSFGGITIAPGRNDGVNRVYACGTFPYEYTWDGNVWIKDSLTTIPSWLVSIVAGFGRNDSVCRIYAGDQGDQLWEFSYDTLNGVWIRNKIDDRLGGWLFTVALGVIKNDDTIRVVAGGSDSATIAYTYQQGSGAWAKDTLGIKKRPVCDIVIGNGRNDDTNRVYSAGYGWCKEYTWRGKWDSTLIQVGEEGLTLAKMYTDSLNRLYSPYIDEYLWQANSWQKVQACSTSPFTPIHDLINGVGRADGKRRLYATVLANVAIDTIYAKVFVYEYSYYASTGWEEKKLSAVVWNPDGYPRHTIEGVVTGKGRNDDTNRVYGLCTNGEVFEWTWDDSINGVENEGENVLEVQKVGKVLKVAPNPFSHTTSLKYLLEKREQVVIKIYNIAGQAVDFLIDEIQTPGEYRINWSGKNFRGNKMPNGIYFACYNVGKIKETKKIILLR